METSDVEQITGLDQSKVFWYGTNGEWLFTCPLDDHDWEIIGRVAKPDDGNRSTWGRTVEASELADSFSGYCEPVRQLLSLVTKVKRYDYFGGSRLETVTDHVNVALVGDASHPLAGAFGAGAAFALEDSHVLAGSLRWAASKAKGLGEALQLFDSVRSPHYKALYQTVGEIATAHKQTSLEATSEEQNITGHVRNVSWPKNNWMYYHEVGSPVFHRLVTLH